jgi:hypothetical protein
MKTTTDEALQRDTSEVHLCRDSPQPKEQRTDGTPGATLPRTVTNSVACTPSKPRANLNRCMHRSHRADKAAKSATKRTDPRQPDTRGDRIQDDPHVWHRGRGIQNVDATTAGFQICRRQSPPDKPGICKPEGAHEPPSYPPRRNTQAVILNTNEKNQRTRRRCHWAISHSSPQTASTRSKSSTAH